MGFAIVRGTMNAEANKAEINLDLKGSLIDIFELNSNHR